jgi:hypothetical protein
MVIPVIQHDLTESPPTAAGGFFHSPSAASSLLLSARSFLPGKPRLDALEMQFESPRHSSVQTD